MKFSVFALFAEHCYSLFADCFYIYPVPYSTWSQQSIHFALFFFAYYGFIGVFTPYAGLFFAEKGMSIAQIGVLMSLMQVMRIFGPNLWGWVADRSQKRVLVLRLTALAAALSFSGMFCWPDVYAISGGDDHRQLVYRGTGPLIRSIDAVGDARRLEPVWPHPAVGVGWVHPFGYRSRRTAGPVRRPIAALDRLRLAGHGVFRQLAHAGNAACAGRTRYAIGAKIAAPARSNRIFCIHLSDDCGALGLVCFFFTVSGTNRL